MEYFHPYPHQIQAWNNMDKHFIEKSFKRGLIVVPTGGGKTTIAVKWLIDNYINNGYRVLWLSHRVELLKQAYDTFLKFSYLNENIIKDKMVIVSSKYAPWSSVKKDDIVVFSTDKSTANSKSYLQLMLKQSKKGVFVVIDEAHHAVASQYQDIIKTIFKYKGKKDKLLLGLTATPVRMNPYETQILWKLFDDNYDIPIKPSEIKNDTYASKIFEISQTELINKGILASPIPITVETKIDFEKEFTEKDIKYLEQYGELGPDILKKLVRSSIRNKKIVEHYKSNMDKYGKTIVFAVDIAHCKTLNEEFRKNGIDSDYVVSGKEDNDIVIKNFKEKDSPKVLISVIKLTEGFDAPKTQTIFITRPTRSEALLRQMIGRGLRGPAANGTEKAYLVTFVDTWKLFKPISTEYIVNTTEIEEVKVQAQAKSTTIPVPDDLIFAAYELLQKNRSMKIVNIFDALPHSWYQWTDIIDGEEIDRSIIVFDSQVNAYEKLIEYYSNPNNSIPDVLNEENVKKIIYDFFDDCEDPLPNESDIVMLLGALRKKLIINNFTFEEKKEFDVRVLAKKFIDLNRIQLRKELKKVYDQNTLCRKLYKNIFNNFYDEVSREIDKIVAQSINDTSEKILIPNHEKPEIREWITEGYNLMDIVKSVVYDDNGNLNKIHFPDGEPPNYRISFTNKNLKSYFGICRYSDKTIKINKLLNSPDVPRFVLEFLVYHELLHTVLPNNGHDNTFRIRERQFTPSKKAIKEADKLGYLYTDSVDYYWYTVSNQFLDTLSLIYKINYNK